ncbi:YcaO-like family protein [Streptomyces sp. NPDC050355]|uniref:YcaO-like family protein n=1 Tax=Streptomyces sp. NPDC050355 TaxID=3365609 RepID=UPI00378E56C0
MRKVFFTGTHRVRAPEETHAALVPLLQEYGITRLADVTGLDTLGIPVVMSVRPLATTLSVSQGKGANKLLASISAAMEAIELWHAENAVPTPTLCATPASALNLPYEVTELDWPAGNLATEHTRMDWIDAHTLPHEEPLPVPWAAVSFGRSTGSWSVPGLLTSSNGLASGNTVDEATVHALYEVIERDSVAALSEAPIAQRQYVDPATVDDEHCADLISRISRAGGFLEVEAVPARVGVACMTARLWHEDLASSVMQGSGAHGDPAVALSRALTEAAQSRLTQISGTRDDISSTAYHPGRSSRPVAVGRTLAWADIRARCPDRPFDTDTAEADWLAGRIRELTSAAPMRVILANRTEFAVVKVLCPGMRHHQGGSKPRSVAVGQPEGRSR